MKINVSDHDAVGFKLLAAIAGAELLIMLLYDLLPADIRLTSLEFAFADALALSVAASLLIYYWVVKPLKRASRTIEEYKQLEGRLRTSENQYRVLFDTAPECIKLLAPDGAILDMNAAGLAMHEAESLEQIQGQSIYSIIAPEYVEAFHGLSARVFNGGSGTLEFETTGLKGTRLWESTHAVPFRNAEGEVVSLLAVTRDITEQKQAEEKLSLAKHDWEETFNSITDMITVHDKDFNIIRSNKAAEQILGLPFLENCRAKCYAYYHGTEGPPEDCPSCQTLKTGRPSTTEFFESHLGKFIEVRAIPRFDARNQLNGLIHIVRDITERKRSDEQIQRQLQQLSALHTVDIAISSSFDIRITLDIFLEQVLAQLRVDAACVLLLNPQARILEFAAERGFRTKALQHTRMRLGQGHAGRAALDRRTVHVPDLRNDEGFSRAELLPGEEFLSYFGVPLIAKGQVKGVLEIFHRSALNPDQSWHDFLDALSLQAAIAIDNTSLFEDLEKSNLELVLAYDATIEGWSRALDYRDKETEGHSQRVTEVTLRICRDMGMREADLTRIRWGALLHDIGKLGVPDGILFKPGKLDDDEWKIMKQHPVIAYELLRPIRYLGSAADIPYCHHERWDGTGYPRGIKGEQIPLAARIFAVVDIWDALTSDRPYRPAWPEEKVMEHIRSLGGSHLDPEVVAAFLMIMRESAPSRTNAP